MNGGLHSKLQTITTSTISAQSAYIHRILLLHCTTVLLVYRSLYREDLKSLEYTTLCLKESMRLLPPVPTLARDLEEDLEIADGIVAAKGKITPSDWLNCFKSK